MKNYELVDEEENRIKINPICGKIGGGFDVEIIWSDLLLSIRGLRLIIELIKNTYGVDAITQ